MIRRSFFRQERHDRSVTAHMCLDLPAAGYKERCFSISMTGFSIFITGRGSSDHVVSILQADECLNMIRAKYLLNVSSS